MSSFAFFTILAITAILSWPPAQGSWESSWNSFYHSVLRFMFLEGSKEPPYTVIRDIAPDVEERIYESRKWICSEGILYMGNAENWAKYDAMRSELFMRLSRYTHGENDDQRRMEQTVPILTIIANPHGNKYSFDVCFLIPEEYQNNTPWPIKHKVRIVHMPELHVYAQRYTGYSTHEEEKRQMMSLAATLQRKNISYFQQDQGFKALHFFGGYDSPTKFWSRRNEIWLLDAENEPLPAVRPTIHKDTEYDFRYWLFGY